MFCNLQLMEKQIKIKDVWLAFQVTSTSEELITQWEGWFSLLVGLAPAVWTGSTAPSVTRVLKREELQPGLCGRCMNNLKRVLCVKENPLCLWNTAVPLQDAQVQFYKSHCSIRAWPLPQFLVLSLCFPPPSRQVLTSSGSLTLVNRVARSWLFVTTAWREVWCDWCCISVCFVARCLFLITKRLPLATVNPQGRRTEQSYCLLMFSTL